MPSRILALDHGTKRIGVALSDELGWTAQPLETFERRTLERDIAHIRELVRVHDVGRVVLGLPLGLNGEEGPAARSVQEFVTRLGEALSVPVVTWDERMTTKAAENLLIAADVSRKKRKGVVDRVAAAILLRSYLEAHTSASWVSPSGGTDRERIEERVNGAEIDQCYDTAPDRDHRGPRRRARRARRVSGDAMD
jgi:putative Holliday junction resolvase